MLGSFLTLIKSLSPKEFTLFLVASGLTLLTGVLLIIQFIQIYTVALPAEGGTFTEGSVGQISYLNPILAREGSADRDAVALLFASARDLASSLAHSNDFRTWDMRIKEGAMWHDGSPITSDDIIFTVQMIQHPDASSPLAASWEHITVTRVSERELRFQAVNSYALFENLLRDLRPVPKKYFANLSPANIRLSAYNLNPVGSGPFALEEVEKRQDGFITSIVFSRNPGYEAIAPLPHLHSFVELYFEDEDGLVRAFNKGLVDGFGTFTPTIGEHIELRADKHTVPSSRYYALFFNPNAHAALASQQVRQALALFINKETVVRDVFRGNAVPQTGPLPAYWETSGVSGQPAEGNVSQARELLAQDGWFFDDVTRTWNKISDDTAATLGITIKIPDSPLIRQIAESVRAQWQEAGVQAHIQVIDASAFSEDTLRTRNYEGIIFGNILLENPDFTSFWHSNERFYPGLNFSLLEQTSVDRALADLRALAPESPERDEALAELANEIVSAAPAAFLVSPQYLYFTRSSSVGAPMDAISTPDTRFARIGEWYAKTRRVSR
jgi:peptide/nickel transport system substrate-binding protein